MRIFITSTPEELAPYQTAACEVVTELGHQFLLRDPDRGRGLKPVPACTRQVADADAVLAIVGHRRGDVPPPGLGGDGRHPWTWWETRAAFDRGLPVAVLLASDAWRAELREDDAKARSVMLDFRGELARLALPFDDDPGQGFRELIRAQLAAVERQASTSRPDVELRRWPPPELPARPYPVLLPYTHPELLAGRDRELSEGRQLLAQPVPILGLRAPSGTGKSSFLAGGLVPTLRAEGRPVAFDRHPAESGIVRRLLGDLLDGDRTEGDDEFHVFVDRLRDVFRLAEAPSVLVLDQFEDLLRYEDAASARAAVGTLLAASVQRQPGLGEPPCRWLLAYRQEFHGEVFQWLADVLRDARKGGWGEFSLPHNLSSSDRFQSWRLSPLGTPGTDDRVEAASRVFQAAVERPLALYPWRFANDGAARLGRAFGEARVRQPNAPLVPELQVVLAHLLQGASPQDDGVGLIHVPEDPGELLDRALEEHLKRSLDLAFPAGRETSATKIRRTRALLALRELADAQGRRDEGRGVTALARAIGQDGRDVLAKLATPQTRLVLLEGQGDEQTYALSHDRMAEVVVRLVDDEGAYAGLGVDSQLLGLRRFVVLQRELFASGEVEQSLEVPKDRFSSIERHADALLWDGEGRSWWEACRERRRLDRRRKVILRSLAGAFVALLATVVWIWADRYFERRELLETIVSGNPEASFAALADLTAESNVDTQELLSQIELREQPFDVLERGLGGVDPEERGTALLRVAELLLPLVGEDPVRIASAVWALDFFAVPDPALSPRGDQGGKTLRERAVTLRDEALGPLRRRRRPPPPPDLDDPGWADIPAGTFLMGSGPGEGRDDDDKMNERPKHPVRLSAFRMMVHEVTNAEFRRLFPEHRGAGGPAPEGPASRPQGEEDLPAVRMTWYEAYSYAAWLGGRLPTEAEWEYAARAGCPYAYCKRGGSEASLDDVAWWVGNSTDPETGEPSVRLGMQLEPNPWGLYDIYGNIWEINANWYHLYPEGLEVDPPGITNSLFDYRMRRGGSVSRPAEWVVAPGRGFFTVGRRSGDEGLRVVFPENLQGSRI